MMRTILSLLLFIPFALQAQTQVVKKDTNDVSIDDLLNETAPTRVYVKNAFKSTRVINGQSMEMLGKGVLDFRILHRFGQFKGGLSNFFGLDQASMRLGLDYGIHRNWMVGIGRSTYQKEIDAYVKHRISHQHTGKDKFPVSILWVSGITVNTLPFSNAALNSFGHRLGYFHQAIVGRKFNESFTLQLTPTLIHRNLVELNTDKNNMIAMGIGGRIKLTNRSAFILDTYPILYGARKNYQYFPLSIGLDIETGGHVFQLHITNARGMNERTFMTETFQTWGKGEIQFGFNLSRVFTVAKNTETSW